MLITGDEDIKIYRLTRIGKAAADNPNNNDTPGLQICNFLRKHGYEGSDDLIMQQTGVTGMDLLHTEKVSKAIYVVG